MNTMLVVTDMDKTVEFYKSVLGLEVVMDFGANKDLDGRFSLADAGNIQGIYWYK